MTAIVRFYTGGTDDRGRRLDDILKWDDDWLEDVHDYIQWLFPLDKPSAVNPHAPLVTASDRHAFRDDPGLRTNLERAFLRMLEFYGYQLDGAARTPVIARSDRWANRSRNWLRPANHNFLRLTRIMRSLALLGRPELARALFDALTTEHQVAPRVIGATTFSFWQAAVLPTSDF